MTEQFTNAKTGKIQINVYIYTYIHTHTNV